MFSGSNDLIMTSSKLINITLHADNNLTGIGFRDGGFGAIALIGSAPTVIFNHGNCRSKDPVQTGDSHLFSHCFANTSHQCWIISRTQTNIMWKQSGTNHIIMAMYGVCTPNNRNTCTSVASIHRRAVIGVSER